MRERKSTLLLSCCMRSAYHRLWLRRVENFDHFPYYSMDRNFSSISTCCLSIFVLCLFTGRKCCLGCIILRSNFRELTSTCLLCPEPAWAKPCCLVDVQPSIMCTSPSSPSSPYKPSPGEPKWEDFVKPAEIRKTFPFYIEGEQQLFDQWMPSIWLIWQVAMW